MSTQVILTAKVEHLGDEGASVKVADGYARNFLIPQGLAMPATAGNLRRVDGLRKKREAEEAAAVARATAAACFCCGVGEGDAEEEEDEAAAGGAAAA